MSKHISGVGLKLTGYPTDTEEFKWVLAKEGCHPDAADRILKRISEVGFDNLTVMNRLNFDWIQGKLGSIGVVMTYIEPIDWYQKYENSEWPQELLDKILDSKKLHGHTKSR